MEELQRKQIVKLDEFREQDRPTVENLTIFKLANVITASRILLLPFVILLLVYSDKYPFFERYALYALVYMQLSDVVDGLIARHGQKKYNKRNYLGEALDPVADKLFINSTFITLSITHGFPFWITFIIFFRDAILVVGWLLGVTLANVKDITPNVWGKCADTCQAFLIFFFLLNLSPSIIKLSWRITIFFTVASGIINMIVGYRRISKNSVYK